jgi:hypothetical protein
MGNGWKLEIKYRLISPNTAKGVLGSHSNRSNNYLDNTRVFYSQLRVFGNIEKSNLVES